MLRSPWWLAGALALTACSNPSNEVGQAAQASDTEESPSANEADPKVVFMDAGALVRAIRKDPTAVAKQFAHDRVMLKGTVIRVGHADQYMAEVIVHTPGEPGQVSLFAADDEIAQARAEQPGKVIAVSCTNVMPPADDITARDCVGFD